MSEVTGVTDATGANGASGSNGASGKNGVSAATLRAEIDRTRSELSNTVAALAAKTDVKARASDAVADAKTQVGAGMAAATRRPVPMALVGAAIGAVVAWLIWRSSRS